MSRRNGDWACANTERKASPKSPYPGISENNAAAPTSIGHQLQSWIKSGPEAVPIVKENQ
jgi:hypothetical protein